MTGRNGADGPQKQEHEQTDDDEHDTSHGPGPAGKHSNRLEIPFHDVAP